MTAIWWTCFRDERIDLRLFTCFRAWRYRILCKKQRRVPLSGRELEEFSFFDLELPLHSGITSLHHASSEIDGPFQLMVYICDTFEGCEQLQDHQNRIALYYALHQRWDMEKLAWLIQRSTEGIGLKDSDGLSPVTHALLNDIPEPLVLLIAVVLARNCVIAIANMVQERNVDSCRRYCGRMVGDYFCGVPHFDYPKAQEILHKDPYSVAKEMKELWEHFIDTWGHYGQPSVLMDLPSVLDAAIDSFVRISVIIKGEPLKYRWYCNDELVEGADQSQLIISQSVQWHDQGKYRCQITNWKGTIDTAEMELKVFDDRDVVDPSRSYVANPSALQKGDILQNVKACYGGIVSCPISGIYVFLPPQSFRVLNTLEQDLANTLGMDVVIHTTHANEWEKYHQGHGILRPGDFFVSCLVDFFPSNVEEFKIPVTISIPHSASSTTNNQQVDENFHELVVVQISKLEPEQNIKSSSKLECTPIPKNRVRRGHEYIDFDVKSFGTFAVIARKKVSLIPTMNNANSSFNNDSDVNNVLEDVQMVLVRPRAIVHGSMQVPMSLYAVISRRDCITKLLETITTVYPPEEFLYSVSRKVSICKQTLLWIQIGPNIEFQYVWNSNTHALVEEFDIDMKDLTNDGFVDESLDIDYPVYAEVNIQVSIVKSSIRKNRKSSQGTVDILSQEEIEILKRTRRNVSTTITSTINALNPFLVDWKLLFPLYYQEIKRPSLPIVASRAPEEIAFEWHSMSETNSNNNTTKSASSPKKKAERLFTPYFYILEVARFTKTFWERYDRMWWFDKTKTPIIEGMYQTAHMGDQTNALVYSNVFAASIRVIQCSIDVAGQYSDPLLLEPLQQHQGDVDDSIVLRDKSKKMDESSARLEEIFTSVYITEEVPGQVQKMFGLDSMSKCSLEIFLERHRCIFRASNREVALLLAVLTAITNQVKQIQVNRPHYQRLVDVLLLIERLVPGLDFFPTDYFDLTKQLHQLLKECFVVFFKLSSCGWFYYFLLGKTFEFELQDIFKRISSLFEKFGEQLRGAQQLSKYFMATCTEILFDPNALNRDFREDLMRRYVLMTLSRHRSNLFVTSEKKEAKQIIPSLLASVLSLQDNNQIADEWCSKKTDQALEFLRKEDQLEIHILDLFPKENEQYTTHVPDKIRICLDDQIIKVDCIQVIKILNVDANCPIQGRAEFIEMERTLEFTPFMAFEPNTTYQIKIRAQDIYTTLGSLHQSKTYSFFTSR